jgi:hypothetical protein
MHFGFMNAALLFPYSDQLQGSKCKNNNMFVVCRIAPQLKWYLFS